MPARRERASLSLSTFSLCKCFNGTVESALWRALSRWREGGRPPARSSAHRALLVAPPCGPHPPALLDAQFKGVSVRGHVVCEWLPKAVSARLRMPVTCTRQVELLACRHFFVGLRTRNISLLSSLSLSLRTTCVLSLFCLTGFQRPSISPSYTPLALCSPHQGFLNRSRTKMPSTQVK